MLPPGSSEDRLAAALAWFAWALLVHALGREPLGAAEAAGRQRSDAFRTATLRLAIWRFTLLAAALGLLGSWTPPAILAGAIAGAIAVALTIARPYAAAAADGSGRAGSASQAALLEIGATGLFLLGTCAALAGEAILPDRRIVAALDHDVATVGYATAAFAIAAAFVTAARGGTLVVRGVLDRVGPIGAIGAIPDETTPWIQPREYSVGRVIGRLERWLLLLFVIAGSYAAIGFLVAAKGLLRMRDAEDRRFSEYVVIGTLTSILVAAVLGAVLRYGFGIGAAA